MGDDYSGPVTVAADDGSERVLANIDVWSQVAPNKTQEQLFIHDMVSWQLAQI